MHENLGIRRSLADVIELRLNRCQVVLCAALQDVASAKRGETRNLHDVLPDIFRQDGSEPRKELFLGVAFPLKIDPVAIQKHGAPIAKDGSDLSSKSSICVTR